MTECRRIDNLQRFACDPLKTNQGGSWTQGLTPEQLQRVRTSVVVRDFAAEAHVCHAGDPANVWVGVIDGLVRMVSFNPQLYPGTERQIEMSQEELGHVVGASRQRIS